MKHEVFILGGQRIDQKSKKGWERLGEMRKGRRERIEKGNHCFFKSSGLTSWSSSKKIGFFFKLIECIIKKKICHGVKQYAKICALGEQNVIN